MKTSVRLIILGHTKYSDHSIVLHTLSDLYGRRSFLVSVGGRTGMGFFLPLNLLEAEVWENPKATLWRASSFSSLAPLSGLRSSMSKNAMSLFMSEVLFRALREGYSADGLFSWCERCVLTLDGLGSDFSNYHVRFLLELCTRLGFAPSTDALAPFAGDLLPRLSDLSSLPLAEAMLVPMSGRQRREACEAVLSYLETFAETPLRIRSLDVLAELFA